jgi:hypothetical protein
MEYNKKDIVRDPEILNIGKLTEASQMGRIEAPCITVIGDKVILDRSDGDTADVTNWLKNTMPDFDYKDIYIGGHSDGVFHTLKPGAMLALHDIETYKDNFTNWDICYLPDQHWDALSEFRKIKHKIEPVHIPWRHRYFWDGGLHCITLDLEREGSKESVI